MLLVDAANVVGSRPNGWWRDRAQAASKLVEAVRVATAASRLAPPVVVVLEGAARPGAQEGAGEGVTIVHAPGEGDDTLFGVAATATEQVVLVSPTRRSAHGVAPSGQRWWARGWLLDRLDP